MFRQAHGRGGAQMVAHININEWTDLDRDH